MKEPSGCERPDVVHSQRRVLGTFGEDEELERKVGIWGPRLWSLGFVLQQWGATERFDTGMYSEPSFRMFPLTEGDRERPT